jgi:long-chain fatty acid transport protein
MKKLILLTFSLILTTSVAYSGGIVTNYNQSAAYIRMFVRDATTEIDAVFYNPAGLTKLEDGWHFSFSAQNLTQERTVNSTFPYLNDADFIGEAKVPIFPSFYTAYKTGKFAFSFGFNPVGGGGTATYNNGLPTMEIPLSTLVPQLGPLGVSAYSAQMMFKGYSVYFGFQGGVSYEINENLSVFAGMRYVKATTTYEGYINDIEVTTPAGVQRADDFLNGTAGYLTGVAGQASGAGASMDGIFALGIPNSLTFAQAEGIGLPAATSAQLQGALLAFGLTPAQVAGMTLAQAQGTFYGLAAGYTDQATQLSGTAILMGDQEADVEQTGSGITPIIGANISLLDEDLNIGLKYEFKTEIELTNETAPGKGFAIGLTSTGQKIEMFPDGAKTNADMPAMLSVGFEYKLTDPLKFSAGYHTYFDGKTGWAEEGGISKIDKNSIEFAAGLEYKISDKLLISGGYLRTVTGSNGFYMSDITHALNSNSGSIGGAYNISENLRINFGIAYTKYETTTYDQSYNLSGNTIAYKESYGRDNFTVAVGIDFSIFK